MSEEFSLIIITCQCVKGVDNVVYVTSCQGVSDLSLLVSEMRRAFQKDTPLYARSPVQAPPPAGVQVSQSAGRSVVFIWHASMIIGNDQWCLTSCCSQWTREEKNIKIELLYFVFSSCSIQHPTSITSSSFPITSSSPHSRHLSLTSSHLSGQKGKLPVGCAWCLLYISLAC